MLKCGHVKRTRWRRSSADTGFPVLARISHVIREATVNEENSGGTRCSALSGKEAVAREVLLCALSPKPFATVV